MSFVLWGVFSLFALCSMQTAGAVFPASSLLQAGGAFTLSPRFGGVFPLPQEGGHCTASPLPSRFKRTGAPAGNALASLSLQASGGTCPFLRLQRGQGGFLRFGRLPVRRARAVRPGAFWSRLRGAPLTLHSHFAHSSGVSPPSVRRSTMSRAFRSPSCAFAIRAFASEALTL